MFKKLQYLIRTVRNNPEELFCIIFRKLRNRYYKRKFGGDVNINGPIRVCGDYNNIVIKGLVSFNAFCVLGAANNAKIIIGDNVRISPGAIIISYGLDTDTLNKRRSHIRYGDIILEDNVWIGSNSTIVGNVKIGKNSVVAAGAVVVKDVPANSIVAGVPARIIKRLKETKESGIQ